MKLPKILKPAKAYTLIHLLLFIGVVTIIGLGVFILLNPNQRIKDAKDAKRFDDVELLLNSIHQYKNDNQGSLPPGFTTGMNERQIGTADSGCVIETNGCATINPSCIDVESSLSKYFKTVPIDPDRTKEKTGYTVSVDSNNIITIKACGSENAAPISVSR